MNERLKVVLHTHGPAPELAEVDRIYDWLIGSWKARVIDYPGDGSRRESTGEWHFGWVLEGRAIQDVWISPPCALRTNATALPGNRYGASLRFFHPLERVWHVCWINPVTGAHDYLRAGREGGDIVQRGVDAEGNQMRWVFTDICATSTRWYAERLLNGAQSWRLEAEFLLERD